MRLLENGREAGLAAAFAEKGYRVIAPVAAGEILRLAEWSSEKRLDLEGMPVNSLKDVFLPRSEVVGRAALAGDDFELKAVEPAAPKTVVLGAKPCDAAALAALDAVFNWDFRDGFFNARRAATAIVVSACVRADGDCFCTSVGGKPDSTAGADAVLRPADGGQKLVFEPLTDKGRFLSEAASGVLREGTAAVDAPPQVPRRFDSRSVSGWLAKNFDSPLWMGLSLPCLGCGACAYACPVCHCFDLQDEADPRETARYRNWDACGFGLFTLHAGGHNPRCDQSARWRQRVMHKLSYFPERFQTLACTGCGRCARLCQAGMSLAASAERIEAVSREEAA